MSLSVTRRGGVYSSYSLFFFLYFVDSQNENGLKETATVVTAEGVGESINGRSVISKSAVPGLWPKMPRAHRGGEKKTMSLKIGRN